MFDPAKELAVAVVALVAASLWWYFDANAESRAAFGVSIAATIAAAIHLAYRLGVESISDHEWNDIYVNQKDSLVAAKKRLARERPNLDQLADDVRSAAGNPYTEKTPFELLPKDLYPLREFKGYGKLVDAIVAECYRILTLPSGKRDVSKLMPLLKSLDRKLAARLREERVWR